MTKEELALQIVARLKVAYPDVDCTLEYDQAWKLLVSVRLAAQCTDARVNVVTLWEVSHTGSIGGGNCGGNRSDHTSLRVGK